MHRETNSNSRVNIAIYTIARIHKYFGVAIIMKDKNTYMFQVSTYNSFDPDILTHSINTRNTTAYTADNQIHFYAGLRSFIQLIDKHLFFSIIQLDCKVMKIYRAIACYLQ